MQIERIDETSWRLLRHGKMRVDGVVFADEHVQKILDDIGRNAAQD